MRKVAYIYLFAVFTVLTACIDKDNRITLESLLDEMVSVEESARLPEIPYRCFQVSSYDRASVSPDSKGWFANNDGFGIERIDTIGERIERVLFDERGPGVITRIWITTVDKRGVWKFYFDDSKSPNWIIPAYDLMKFGIPELGRGLLQPHTSYVSDEKGRGGSTLFIPIPFARACKITFEDELGIALTPKYYQINYRKYPESTVVETFSAAVADRAADKISETEQKLLNPPAKSGLKKITQKNNLLPGDSLVLQLPEGENAVYEVSFNIDGVDSLKYAQLMRNLVFSANFDNEQTVFVPLSDYSGGGMGAPAVQSWFLTSDGKGRIISRWLMPYSKDGELLVLNMSPYSAKVFLDVKVAPLRWDNRSLYFHASWKQERNLTVYDKPDDLERCKEWNFAELSGKGIYKGDVLTLYNHSPAWYGEGDEKIWVDNDTFPSHFGTGTEDYYNSSWAPVIVFQTPFGGAPRADLKSSHGYNTFFRTRNLDGIPFNESLRFSIELLSWVKGMVDYATTVYWYGDKAARASGISDRDEVKRILLPIPLDPAKYKRKNSLEFEEISPINVSPSLRVSKQDMVAFIDGQWSGAAQLVCNGGREKDFIEFEFDGLKSKPYQVVLYATKASDYGIISFAINGKSINKLFDGYDTKVTNSKPIRLGSFIPENGKITLKIILIGTNVKSIGERYMFGLDCVQLIER